MSQVPRERLSYVRRQKHRKAERGERFLDAFFETLVVIRSNRSSLLVASPFLFNVSCPDHLYL